MWVRSRLPVWSPPKPNASDARLRQPTQIAWGVVSRQVVEIREHSIRVPRPESSLRDRGQQLLSYRGQGRLRQVLHRFRAKVSPVGHRLLSQACHVRLVDPESDLFVGKLSTEGAGYRLTHNWKLVLPS